MNKLAKAKELTLGGCIMLVIAGILFLSASSSDTTGLLVIMGTIFFAGGLIGLIAVIANLFK